MSSIMSLVKETIVIAGIDGEKRLKRRSHGNQLRGNNFAFIRFKAGFGYHLGGNWAWVSSHIVLNNVCVICVKKPITSLFFCFHLHAG